VIYGAECTHWFEDVGGFCGARARFAQYDEADRVINVYCDAHRVGACQEIPPSAERAAPSTFWDTPERRAAAIAVANERHRARAAR
jgi:hypothetical protein